MAAIGSIAAIAGLCLLAGHRITTGSDAAKLESDISTLNSAVVYLVNGGSFTTGTDVETVLAKLKTTPLSAVKETFVGMRGSMIDMRVTAVPMTTEEESGFEPRAVWDDSSKRLKLVTTGPGVKEFVLGIVPPIVEEVRNSTVEYAHVSDWIWDYGGDEVYDRTGFGDNVATSNETPPSLFAGGSGDSGGPYNPLDNTKTLAPPIFSVDGGFYEYTSFPLSLNLAIPSTNPEGTCVIMYRIDGGSWEFYPGYSIILPGDYQTLVEAYCSSLDPDVWNNSVTNDEVYETLFFSGTSDADFTTPLGGEDLVYTITDTETGSVFEWGTPADGYTLPSRLEFTGASFANIAPEQEFVIGSLNFFNGTIESGTGADGVELDLDLTVSIPIGTQDIKFTFELINTPNSAGLTEDEKTDYVRIQVPTEEFTTTVNDVTYWIEISFGSISSNGFTTIDEFHVWENNEAEGEVLAKITATDPNQPDTVAPVAALSTPIGSVGGQFEVTASWSELVQNFLAGDLTLTNGSLASFAGNGMLYSIFITPVSDGLITIQVPANVANDIHDNENTASNLLSVIADLTPPTPQLSYDGNNISPSYATAGSPLFLGGVSTFDLTFDEPVVAVDLADFIVENLTVSNLQGSGSSYTIDVIAEDFNQIATLNYIAGGAIDGVGNASLAHSDTAYLSFDNVAPTVILATAESVVDEPFLVTAEMSEAVTGFSSGDVFITNGTLSNFGSSGNTFSWTVTPGVLGNVDISIASNQFTDVVGNSNEASNILSVNFNDITPPESLLATTVTETEGDFIVTATASETISGFVSTDVAVTNGAVSGFTVSGNIYTWTVSPQTLGAVLVSVPAGSFADSAGNTNDVASNQLSVDFTDLMSPTLVLASSQTSVAGDFVVTAEGAQSQNLTWQSALPCYV